MSDAGTLLLTRRDVESLLDLPSCIEAVEAALRSHGEGRAPAPAALGIPCAEGGFHVKAALMANGRSYFAAKVNGNFFSNPGHGLPRIQGLVILCDGANGSPLAVLDSIAITVLRTGAATAVAARLLARPESSILTLVGCGNQGRVHASALRSVLPISEARLFDVDPERAAALARELSSSGLRASAARDLADAVSTSDVVVTLTPSREAFLRDSWVRPGAFVAAVGADSAEKQELEPALLSRAAVFVDSLEQCAQIGDLHHALTAGAVARESVRGELGEVLAGRRRGRSGPEEIIVFDSTGIALEDVAAAALVYERATASGRGTAVRFA